MKKDSAAISREAAAIAACYTTAFQTPEGKRVLDDLTAKYPSDRSRFEDGGKFNPDTHRAAFRDGQSSIVTEILAAIERGKKSQPDTHP